MKKKIILLGPLIIVFLFSLIMIIQPREIKVSEVISLVQSNYQSITVNDKHIEAGTNNQYLIDDFIAKLSRYTIKKYDGELAKDHDYKVVIKNNDRTQITLLDNDYLIIDKQKYKILEGNINLKKFYNVFLP
ncbi:MAG: hypothetical protein ACTH0B_07320 [Senegalia sp. (in: firmicutes)]